MLADKKIIPEHERHLTYKDGEYHKFLGRYYRLAVRPVADAPRIYLQGETLMMETEAVNDAEQRADELDLWYREQAGEVFVPILADAIVRAARVIREVPTLRIYKLLDRWGICAPQKKVVVLNQELIKVPDKCIEYIALHEMVHFKHPSHDFGFTSTLGSLMPDWRIREKVLNEFYPI